jgi:4-nitrophenyl phosphatase
MGFSIPSSSILTAANIVAQILSAEATRGKRCMVIGEEGLLDAIRHAGFEITQSDFHNVDYVVIGMDRQLTYEKLKVATLAIRNGAQFVSSNADAVFPDGLGVIPASGAIQAALEATTGKKARVTGKPNPSSFQIAMKMMGSKPSNTAMIGDQLEVDIDGAKRVGMNAFLVLSSVTPKFIKTNGCIVPDGVFENMLGFLRQLTTR